METLLWILMIIGWSLFGAYARRNHVNKNTIKKMEKAHEAAINKEFHDAFRAGWDAASTDPIIIKSQYNKIFKTPYQN